MYLLINTANAEKILLFLVKSQEVFYKKEVSARGSQTEKLLPALDQFLKIKKIKKENLTGLGVVSGPGSFTALRIGVVTVNLLAHTLQIPAVGVKGQEFIDDHELVKIFLQRIAKTKPGSIVLPDYQREPNITKKARD